MKVGITQLLFVVGIAGFSAAMLARSDEWSNTLFVNFAYLLILFSLPMAIGRQKGAKAFWIGFLAASAGYSAFAIVPDELGYSPRVYGPEFTTEISRFALRKIHPELSSDLDTMNGGFFSVPDSLGDNRFEIQIKNDDPFGDNPFDSPKVGEKQPDSGNGLGNGAGNFDPSLTLTLGSGQELVMAHPTYFMAICHSTWALLFGWIIGHASRFVYERSTKVEQN